MERGSVTSRLCCGYATLLRVIDENEYPFPAAHAAADFDAVGHGTEHGRHPALLDHPDGLT
jgi:hypothetical protein